MIKRPDNQLNLYGIENILLELINLFKKDKLPNKILLSGQKGIGKCTLAYHLINSILSSEESYSYDLQKFRINLENKSFKLIQNKTNPNFTLVDTATDKKGIDINQIRNLISNLNKSSFNSKPRFILIDNIENLNTNSVNALLKVLEEPNNNIFFILIHNNKRILPTLKSRCLNFKISLSFKETTNVCEKLFDSNISNLINDDLMNYYTTPGKIYDLLNFSKTINVDLKKIKLNDLLNVIIDESYYKKEKLYKSIFIDLIELFFTKKNELIFSDFSNYFINKIENTKKFNLDEETLFIEFKNKVLNG
jgi:DNA polymerase-3 subunit delta'